MSKIFVIYHNIQYLCTNKKNKYNNNSPRHHGQVCNMKKIVNTHDGKSISLKQVHSVLRTKNTTEIFRLYHKIYGGKVEKSAVIRFIEEFAPTIKISRTAFGIVYDSHIKLLHETTFEDVNYHAWKVANAKHIALQAFKDNIRMWSESPNYAKRPMMGRTHLWFCSPAFGHRDYNKWCAMPIKGNERFCETICKLADKYFV